MDNQYEKNNLELYLLCSPCRGHKVMLEHQEPKELKELRGLEENVVHLELMVLLVL